MKSARLELLKVDDRHFLFAMITALANRMQMVGDTFFQEVTWKQWFVLLGISIFTTPPTIMQLADTIGTSHQNVKQLLLRLQRAEYVRLEKDPADQRRTLVHLTERFSDFERKYQEESMEFISQMYKGIDEKDILIARKVLESIEANLKRFSEKA